MKNYKYLFIFLFISLCYIFYGQNFKSINSNTFNSLLFQKRYDNLLKTNINFKDFLYNPIKTKLEIGVSFDYMDKLKRLKFKKEENPIRRASILFFGSLTFATFGGWLFFSLFNVLIYDETFGKLRREQFLILYLGTGVISISVVLSDLFINLKPKMKRVEIY